MEAKKRGQASQSVILNFVYTTVNSPDDAKKLAEMIVSKRLAACAHILPHGHSIYWWEGQIESSNETILILKTTADLAPRVVKAVRENHSYQCPCIVTIPVQSTDDYAAWLIGETRPF